MSAYNARFQANKLLGMPVKMGLGLLGVVITGLLLFVFPLAAKPILIAPLVASIYFVRDGYLNKNYPELKQARHHYQKIKHAKLF